GVRAKERPRRAGRLRLRVVSRHELPCLPRPIRIAQVQVAQADLHEGRGRLPVTELEDLLILDLRLPVVVLHVVRLTDPVLGGAGGGVASVSTRARVARTASSVTPMRAPSRTTSSLVSRTLDASSRVRASSPWTSALARAMSRRGLSCAARAPLSSARSWTSSERSW